MNNDKPYPKNYREIWQQLDDKKKRAFVKLVYIYAIAVLAPSAISFMMFQTFFYPFMNKGVFADHTGAIIAGLCIIFMVFVDWSLAKVRIIKMKTHILIHIGALYLAILGMLYPQIYLVFPVLILFTPLIVFLISWFMLYYLLSGRVKPKSGEK